MKITCPHCHSTNTKTKDIAQKAGGSIGAIAGGTAGFASALRGMAIGGTLGLRAGAVGLFAGSLIGAIVGGLLGATTGYALGSELGQIVDQSILDNRHCNNCGQSFSASEPSIEPAP